MKFRLKKVFVNYFIFLLVVSSVTPLITSFGKIDQDTRRITREGMSVTLPIGWKLSTEKVENLFNIYTAENRNAGSINYYRAPIEYSLIGNEFYESSSKDLSEIYNNMSLFAISLGLESSTRNIRDYKLYGKKEIFVCREKKVRTKSFRLIVEYYQLTSEDEVINILISGESGTNDISDIDYIMNSFTVE